MPQNRANLTETPRYQEAQNNQLCSNKGLVQKVHHERNS